MGELPPEPKLPVKPYNRFLGNPPEGATAEEHLATEMAEKKEEIKPTLIHETVHHEHVPEKTENSKIVKK